MGKGETQIHGPCLYDVIQYARGEITSEGVRHCLEGCRLTHTARRTGLMVAGYEASDNENDHLPQEVKQRMRAVGNVYAGSGVLPDVCPRRRQI